tara:strand:+ start:1455 stop:1910 length:456 start_codon:yes stop_codon:yes gene_type:complete
MLVASSPGRKAGDGIATTAASQTAPSNDFNSRVPVVHELFLPSLKQHDTPKCSERRQLNSRAKGQKGNRNSDEVKQSKADKLIMNQKLQASNRNVILGWNLGYMEFWDSLPWLLGISISCLVLGGLWNQYWKANITKNGGKLQETQKMQSR